MGHANPSLWERRAGLEAINSLTNASQLSSFFLRCSNQKLTSFSKKSNEVRLSWSSVSIKLDRLRMFKIRCPIVNFLLLVLEISPNFTLDSVHQSTGVTKTLPKESFKLDQKQEIFDCLVFPMLVLMPTKTDSITKKQNCKQSTVGTSSAGGIKIILAALGSFSVDWLTSGKMTPYRGLRFYCSVREFLTQRSPQEHLDRCVRLNVAGRFCKSENRMPSLWSLAQSNWAFPNRLADPLGMEKLEL